MLRIDVVLLQVAVSGRGRFLQQPVQHARVALQHLEPGCEVVFEISGKE